jgi:thiol-disulfide isomerase/thioredoxin
MLPVLLVACGRDQPAALLVGTSTFAPDEREPMPPISGTTLDGRPLDLADSLGRVVVLNAWASWCGPCQDEIPALVALAASLDPAQAEVVGLNVSDDVAAATAFASTYGVPYPSIEDAKGTILPTIPGVPPAALPSTVVIDRQGRIAARVIGAADEVELRRIVTSVTSEAAPA